MILYTSTNCKGCETVKQHFAEQGIECTTVNITEDQRGRKRAMQLGIASVPTLFTGNEIIIGAENIVKRVRDEE